MENCGGASMVRCTCMLTAEAFDVARKPCQLAVLVDLELELSDGIAGIRQH